MTAESFNISPAEFAIPRPRPAVSRRRARLAAYIALGWTDTICILGGFWLAAMLRGQAWLEPGGVDLGMVTLLAYMLFAANQSAFSLQALGSVSESIRRAMSSLLLASLLVVLFIFLLHSSPMISRLAFTVAIGASAVGIGLGRVLTDRLYIHKLEGRLTDTLLIVDGPDASTTRADKHMTVMRAADFHLSPDLKDPAALDLIATIIRPFDRVVVQCSAERKYAWSLALKGTHIIGEILLPEQDAIGAIGIGEFDGRDTLVVSRGPLSLANRIKKRAFDLAITVPSLLFLAPLLVVVAIIIKLESPGPVFFKQKRVGQSNATFWIYKFRSMRAELSDASGNQSTRRDDDRVTRFGKFIRLTSIDELPQLINVLRGEMSVVGPRPHALGSLAGDKLFWEVNERYWLRHALKPGITGLAQIRGHRGATHQRQDLELRLQSDLEYLNGWRLGRDVAIVFGTIRVLIHPNAY
ncbi:MAG: sugar transferase [Sphingopyxis sp.]